MGKWQKKLKKKKKRFDIEVNLGRTGAKIIRGKHHMGGQTPGKIERGR